MNYYTSWLDGLIRGTLRSREEIRSATLAMIVNAVRDSARFPDPTRPVVSFKVPAGVWGVVCNAVHYLARKGLIEWDVCWGPAGEPFCVRLTEAGVDRAAAEPDRGGPDE